MSNQEQLRQFIHDLNSEPKPEHISKNDDGTLYIPISITQRLLDEIFLGMWSFEMRETFFGRKWARGSGVMTVVHPLTGEKIVRGGDAGIILSHNMRTDSPRLEAMILLSCAKKYGKVFGRDLNRTKEDAPLPIVKTERNDSTTEEKRLEILIDECENLKDLESYKLVIPEGLKKKYQSKLKQLSNDSRRQS
jgi:hypothetical protein